ncbi:MAG: hypothetical protein GEV11_10925 [Streptosporangiales bacterium]|nr:hypothetical protein [Streptosporangiales bacterium]
MRVFIPATLPALELALSKQEVGPAPLTGYAVTPALREWYASGDLEELEYAAMSEAARASLRLIAGDEGAPRRRVVLAAELPDTAVEIGPELEDRGTVRVLDPVPLTRIASGHVDDEAALGDVRAAAGALAAADAGDEDARFVVDGAEGHELLWYATQELRYLFE